MVEQDLFDIGFTFVGEGTSTSGYCNGMEMQHIQTYKFDISEDSYISLLMYPYQLEEGRISTLEWNDTDTPVETSMSSYREMNEFPYSHMSNIVTKDKIQLYRAMVMLTGKDQLKIKKPNGTW